MVPGLLRDKDTTSSKAHLPLPGDRGIELLEDRNSLEDSLLCEQGDRPAMAEVYYRFLSWIPMRDPVLLSDELGVILQDVEYLLVQTSLGRMDPAPKTRG